MSTDPIGTPDTMAAVPSALRGRIVSGMRWMLWLSVLSVPFSYGISVILARIGAEALGTYGLLGIYVGLVATLLYFGGNAAVIKFVPELGCGDRISFIASYFLVICLTLMPWLTVASIWPSGLHYLFGRSISSSFQVLILCLSPLYIVYSLSIAGLLGMLDVKWAKGLDRTVTVGSFLVYAMLILVAHGFLVRHYVGAIWGIYLSLIALSGGLGLARFMRVNDWRKHLLSFRFFLPAGFWSYTVGLQGSSALGFLMGRLEYIFILNAGGLAALGKYVAVLTIGSIVPKSMAYFFDSMMPSLTNTLAQKDPKPSRAVVEMYVRLALPVGLGAASFVLLFAQPLLALLGPQYRDLVGLVRLYAPFAAVLAVNGLMSIILNAAGRSQSVAVSKGFRIGFIVVCFWPLWGKYHLLGAVLVRVLGEVLHQLVLVGLVRWRSGVQFSLFPTYGPLIVMLGFATLLASSRLVQSWLTSLPIWLVLILMFLVAARYTLGEIGKLARLVLPWPSSASEAK